MVLSRLKIPIGLSLLIGAVFLGIYNLGLRREFWTLLYHSVVSIRSWRLVLTVGLILTFADIFESAGFVRSLVSSLRTFLCPAWVARAAPAIIGFLPMPGGAMVSAPIVRQTADGASVSPQQLTAVNYWWRHVWEPAWPLYPSIILAASILSRGCLREVSVWQLALINLPISVAAIASGLLLGKAGSMRRESGEVDISSLAKSLWPILLIIVLGLVLKVDLILSVVFVTAIVVVKRRITPLSSLASLAKGFSVEIVILIFGVMTLMQTIEETGAARAFYEGLIAGSIPPLLVVFAVPFLVGLLTGVTAAYIGAALPVVLPLMGSPGVSFQAAIVLAFAGGFMGVMASPVHLCLVLTRRYFQASASKTLTLLALPIGVTSLVSWIVALTLYD